MAERLSEIPASCDCVWSISLLPDGRKSGHIYIASERCQKALMHPRTFTEPPVSASP